MKLKLLQRLKARLAVSRPRKNQGVAILTVLAIITLMTVLVISFFNMAQTAKTTAKGSVEIQRVTTLKDTIINLVIAQFREASRLSPAGATDPRNIITWTSQPGAIRTYSGTDVSRNRLYKLYSSDVPQIESIQPNATSTLLDAINRDNAPDWAERPDEFADINRPVYTAATGDRARATGATDSTGYSFPIVDPRSYNGRNGVNDREKNTEGFSYSDKSGSLRIRGIDPSKEQLAMPVRWIYLLQDGTLGFLDDGKEFKSLTGKGEASRTNPIVGRLAWWADDESSKINVNTASVPAAWDTPRTTSQEDQWLATNQPIAGEFQRYPGHPATVDLSAVFYPNRRFVPTGLRDILGSTGAGGAMSYLEPADARRIWNLAPFIVGEPSELRGSTGGVGTGGGEFPTPSDATVGQSFDDHLFTSMDEVYFKASGTTNKSLNSPRNNLLSEGKDSDGRFLQTLERSSFFLTHKSHSPELTNQGFPRVSMFPMDLLAVPAIGSTGPLPTGVSPYDVTLALNATIGGKNAATAGAGGNAYFFQRRDPGSRHNEMYNGSDSRQRNTRVFRYLKELTRLPIPGYPDAVALLVPAIGSADPTGLSLASKYPPGLNNSGTAIWPSAFGATSLMDSSDRTQILLNMIDYTRSLNMQPAFLAGSDKYDDGWGKAAGICGCANASGGDTNNTHWNALLHTQTTPSRTPKGTGKLYGASEIAVIVNVAAKKAGPAAGDAVTGPWNDVLGRMSAASRARANNANIAGTRYAVEVGFVVGAFNPKMGWSASFPEGGVTVSSVAPNTGNLVFSPDNAALPIIHANIEPLTSGATTIGAGANVAHVTPKGPGGTANGMIPLGGMGGPRALMSQNPNGSERFAMTRAFCVITTTATDAAVPTQLTTDPATPLRIMMMDGNATFDIVQAIDLVFPTNFFTGVNPGLNSESLVTLADKYAKGTRPFPDPKTFMRSFVVPHGDYRLTTTPLRVDADVFVPHQMYSLSGNAGQFASSLWEMNNIPTNRVMKSGGTQLSQYGLVTLINPALVQRYVQTNNVAGMSSLPFGLPDPVRMNEVKNGLSVGVTTFARSDPKIEKSSSSDPARQMAFSHGRRDGRSIVPNRGSSDPTETGDWDNGVAGLPDGPYMNYPDEGDRRRVMSNAYFMGLNLTTQKPNSEGIGGQNISPNFLIRSPVDFGSIPTGIQSRVPWQTLRFRPDPGMNAPGIKMDDLADGPPQGMPYSNFCGPKDHFFLDMFWMPVVEPWSISEPFSTKGTINLNQQIFPFMNIERTTALHALLRGERMLAVPNDSADEYKSLNPNTGAPSTNQENSYRRFINARETVRQFTRRYSEGLDPEGHPLAFNSFRSASEICEIWLVPEGEASTSPITLENTIGGISNTGVLSGFWADHRLTGDNSRERPYANLYPRVTVRSNVFKLHLVAQTLQKATSQDPKGFDSVKDSVTAEWRGSCMIERSIDPRDAALTNIDYTNMNSQALDARTSPRLDRYYTYRVTEVKQLTQ